MEKQLEDVKSQSKIIRPLTTKLITKIECIIKDEYISHEIKIEDLSECKEQLLDKQNSLKELNEKIESLINSEEIEKEVVSREEYSENMEIWEGGFDWDEELGKNLRTKWEKWSKEVHSLVDLSIPSSISNVFRITAWIRRFVNNLKLNKEDRIKTPLLVEEIEEAEEIWIKKVQAENFGIEINCLEENKNLPKVSKIRDLNPFLNEKGILRISGRLQQSTLSYHEKHPIFFLIPAKIRFTDLPVKDAHERMLHSGVADTLIQVREKYWISKGRQIIKSIIRKCFICKKFNSRPGMQITAPLPRDRIEQSPPFAVTGLDFTGPIFVKNSTIDCFVDKKMLIK
ncbi:uncharacterized protein TNCT_163811 [Trichonephila clavata]|uniref:Integrase zinc-binding domain-containing protein n=1 Tax=Trichonephila clavata TaxID=2740835 RepID=A0A8X6KJA5_TRICU|nr:uncharacterized protein TNCT_163811 [Trichonephila clavata]